MIYILNPGVMFLWIAAAWLIGLIGRHKRFGFFGNFLISFLFSPLVGIIVLLASDDRRVPRRP
jgi:hypothetical protein